MNYLRLTKLTTERRLRRAFNKSNGHRPARTEDPLRKSVADANARGRAAGTQLLRSLDELREALEEVLEEAVGEE